MDAWQVPLNHVRRAIDRSALYFCGFPTLQHIKHKVSCQHVGVFAHMLIISRVALLRLMPQSRNVHKSVLARVRVSRWCLVDGARVQVLMPF